LSLMQKLLRQDQGKLYFLFLNFFFVFSLWLSKDFCNNSQSKSKVSYISLSIFYLFFVCCFSHGFFFPLDPFFNPFFPSFFFVPLCVM
jgi:hypothetical protein